MPGKLPERPYRFVPTPGRGAADYFPWQILVSR